MKSSMAASFQDGTDECILGKTRKPWDIKEITAMIYTTVFIIQ